MVLIEEFLRGIVGDDTPPHALSGGIGRHLDAVIPVQARRLDDAEMDAHVSTRGRDLANLRSIGQGLAEGFGK
jgi:hypothetical protein